MVHCLYEQLKKAGIKAHLDIEDNSRGRIGTYIDLINTDDYVVVVGTPELRQKWDKTTKGEKGGVLATELGMVRNKFTEQPNAIIPVLIEGTKESFPPFIVDVVYSNLSDRAIYYKNLFGVIENLYEGIKEIQPQIKEARAIFEQIEKDVMRAKSPEKIKEILNNVSMKYDPPKYELPKEPAQKKTKM